MEKNHKNVAIIILSIDIILILGFLIVYLWLYSPIKGKDNVDLKEIYNSNYENVSAGFRKDLGVQEVGKLDKDTLIKVLEVLKEEELKLVKYREYDILLTGATYRMILKSGTKKFGFSISKDYIRIGNKAYWVNEGTIDKINDILSEYSEFICHID